MTDATVSELLKRGLGYLARDDFAAAEAIADRLAADFDSTAETAFFAGEVQFRRGRYARTFEIAETASDAYPGSIDIGLLRCRALLALGRLAEARDLAIEISRDEITDEQHVQVLVTILTGCLQPEAAYPLAKASAKRHPHSTSAQRRFAINCQATGHTDEGLAAADAAIRLDPHDYEMLGLRSALRTATADDNHIDELEALLAAGCRTPIGAARAAYALAKELEDVGRYERAFSVLQAGASLKRQTLQSSLQKDLDMIRALQTQYTAEVIERGPSGDDTREPVFVLGLPRTGSTLLERMLASHSEIFSAGELLHFEAELMIGLHRLGTSAAPTDIVANSTRLDPAELGRRYLDRTRSHTGHTPHFIDKRPLNHLWLGAIRRALPNATAIHVRRTPMDACYAIFKFLFEDTYPWSYSLEEIALYYLNYRQLMDHWRSIMPGYIVDIAYEDLVHDPEAATRLLTEKIGVDWQPGMLDFHQSASATMTGSATQVRREIYKSSIGRWRSYEKELGQLSEILEAAGIDPYTP